MHPGGVAYCYGLIFFYQVSFEKHPNAHLHILIRFFLLQTFSVLPQSPTHVKVLFYNIHCVDVHIRSEGLVSIRDGSFSMFDQTKVLTDLEPIRGFKAFLYKYVDEAALARRTSQTEDDNPPSPLTMDPQEGQGGLKFAPPQTPPSNPLTPASPHGSQSAGFLQSPPTHRQPSASPAPSPGLFPLPSPGQSGSPFPSAASPLGGSPRPRPSPRNPGSSPNPSMGHGGGSGVHQTPTRILPQRLWAAAIPTPLTFKAFDELCRPSQLPGASPTGNQLLVSPLHRYSRWHNFQSPFNHKYPGSWAACSCGASCST